MTTTTTRAKLEAEIATVSREELPVEHNSGTFGAAECQRAIGTGRTESGEYTIYERVGDGQRRTVGCDPATAPGYPRYARDSINERREYLAGLRKELRSMRD